MFDFLFDIKMKIEVAGVYASIGTSTTRSDYRLLAQKLAQSGLYFCLHGMCVGLSLPSVILAAIVGQPHEVAGMNDGLLSGDMRIFR
jgi:hypothetical protein